MNETSSHLNRRLNAPGPKRILALDGGGLRGMLSLQYLKTIENLLRDRHGADDSFRLADYFDLIAGTSTGAIIAAGLAMGMSVDELIDQYHELGHRVFKRRWWRRGWLRERYREEALIQELRQVFGECTLGDTSLQTGLLIVTKRIDTGSPWPLGNNPAGRYFGTRVDEDFVPNSQYPLWRIVRASTAAPTFFKPEWITISDPGGGKPDRGQFVDGGVSPFNNPSLQALMYACLEGYGLGWPLGEESMLVVSVGTGQADPSRKPASLAFYRGLQALQSLMDDCASLTETLMQWLSRSATSRVIDREIGDLTDDLLSGEPAFTYLRYQLSLEPDNIRRLQPGLPEKTLRKLAIMDAPENLEVLERLGRHSAEEIINPEHFPAAFDLLTEPEASDDTDLKPYRRRAETPVTAIPLKLIASSDNQPGDPLFTYHKWDDTQTAKTGDWLVKNGDEVYTVDRQTFESTYTPTDTPGQYIKTGKVWAKRATEPGTIQTKEGSTRYDAGDWLVFNDPEEKDGYAVGADRFFNLYEQLE